MYSIQLLTLCENDRFLIIELMFLIRLDFGMEQITMETIQWSEVINSLSTYFASSGYNLSDPEKKQKTRVDTVARVYPPPLAGSGSMTIKHRTKLCRLPSLENVATADRTWPSWDHELPFSYFFPHFFFLSSPGKIKINWETFSYHAINPSWTAWPSLIWFYEL